MVFSARSADLWAQEADMSIFNFLRGSRNRSAQTAKDRLQLILVHDRVGISPGKIERLKDDLIQVISRHVEIDQGAVDLSLTKDRNRQKLVANIPLASPRNRRKG
jgi:cell division topological specificity factor